MSRLAQAVLQPNIAHAQGHKAPMLDLQLGNANGYAPDLVEWVSVQPHAPKNLIPLLVTPPKAFRYTNNPDYWTGMLRALVELHAESWTGFTQTMEAEVVETKVGGGGQVFQTFSDITMANTVPVGRWPERYGRSVGFFWQAFMRNFMGDHRSKIPAIATLANKPADQLADMYSFTMMFIEPDPNHRYVVQSYLVANMWPQSSGEITAQRDITGPAENPTHDITFAGLCDVGAGVDDLAQRLLDAISITGADPHRRAAFVQKISEEVTARRKSYGDSVSALAANAVRV